jgi:putative cardiolipin synthase
MCRPPPLEGRPESRALAATADTRIGAAVAALARGNPGKTGIHALPLGADAFAARMALAAGAERSIDAQYYIWHGDQTGVLLFEALANAARRGVRVRILIDDQNSRDSEEVVAALGAEPNVEVRLYNPFAQRRGRFFQGLADFSRLNRRMHNKAFIVDNQAAVVGGRNIGNEYFGAGTEAPFMDLDVLAVGVAVPEVSAQFDLYWNSASAYPARWLVGEGMPGARAALDARFAEGPRRSALTRLHGIRSKFAGPGILLKRDLVFEWVNARVVADDPAKTLDSSARTDVLLLSQLIAGGTRVRTGLDLISPYFVPGEKGSAHLEALARSGIRVRVLTNSFIATDVTPVHSGYAKRREDLVRSGIRLYELKGGGEAREARPRRPGVGLVFSEPAREDVRSGRRAHLRGVLQLRSKVRAAEYRDGPRHRKQDSRGPLVGRLRYLDSHARL